MARSAQKKRQGGVCDAASQILPVGANRRERLENGLPESCDIVALTVGEPLLGQLPDSLVRIELRRIRWKALQVEALRASAKFPNEQATMKTDTVPQHENVASEVAEQLAQEVPRLQLPDVVGVELKVEIQAPPAGRHRDPRDDRDAVSPIEVMDGRGFADGSPGGDDGRCQLESRFVD